VTRNLASVREQVGPAGLGEPGEQSGFEEEEWTQVPILLGDVVNRASFVDAGRDDGPEDEHLTTVEHLAVVVVALQRRGNPE
jgi:hypothetical protein